jgi:cellulose synthase/poly-beta-1,6-N-acetylglucosamine synthase-like glycosyltransferase
MHSFILHLFDYFNAVILLYFIATNFVYMVLMLICLYTVTLHSKFASRTAIAEYLDSPVTPPVALLVPAYNEKDAIINTVISLMQLNYPEKEIIVIDDGSSDRTLANLVEHFELMPMDLIYRPVLPCEAPNAFYYSHRYPELLVVSKPNGGKADALNCGINMARSPYFCTVDADTVIERDALVRLMAPVINSNVNTIVSGGVVRIANGCTLGKDGELMNIDLPKSWIERCQIVEYIRTFLFGRPGWNFLHATFIASGAFCLLHRESVVGAGGFSTDTVTEDIDIIATLHKHMRAKGWKYRMVFTTDPVCWTEAPSSIKMLAPQRRRWQLGLVQTVMKHNDIILDPRYGLLGMLGMPFHAYIEAIGCLVEAIGTILIPFSFLVGAMPFSLFLLIMGLAVGYGTLFSLGSVLLEEATLRRYPKAQHLFILVWYAVIENFGYRQMITFFRAQGVLQYFTGLRRWEHVEHRGIERPLMVKQG